jgi:hypothetical protein
MSLKVHPPVRATQKYYYFEFRNFLEHNIK